MSVAIPVVVHSIHDASLRAGFESDDPVAWALNGLLATDAYNAQVERTVLAGVLTGSVDALRRESGLSILYSLRLGIFAGVTERERVALRQVEQRYGVGLVYATLRCGAYAHEVLLADAAQAARAEGNAFRYACWERFGLDSQRHDDDLRYTLAMNAARPLLAALAAIGATTSDGPKIAVAHGTMGMPLLLAAELEDPAAWRTAFYAYATPAAQQLVERRSGHDTSFYNVLAKAKVAKLALETIYGSQDDLAEHALLRLAPSCDAVLAVSERVADELRFVGGRFAGVPLDVVPFGLPSTTVTPAERASAAERLRAYTAALAGYMPDFLFAHVDPLTVGKGLWRDMRVLEHLDGMLRKQGCRALYLLFASSAAEGRAPDEIAAWEAEYGWPAQHRAGNGDLQEAEAALYLDAIEPLNRRAGNVRAILVNQARWDDGRLGRRMPPGLTLVDCLHGADVVFGQGIYEPFGLRAVEAALAGSLVCVSSACGSVPVLRKVAGELPENIVVADYVKMPPGYWLGSPYDALAIDQGVRDWVEQTNSRPAAHLLAQRLMQADTGRSTWLASGEHTRAALSWESIAENSLLPAMRRILQTTVRRKTTSQMKR